MLQHFLTHYLISPHFPFSFFIQAFQFSLVGASEILAAITSLEFFYSQVQLQCVILQSNVVFRVVL